MIKSGTVDDSTDILARCASTTLAGVLRASTSSLDPEMATGPSCDFDGNALQAVVRYELSSPATAGSLSEPSWSVAECMTDGGAMDVLDACDGTTPGGLLLHDNV